jgi:hypothetical protein
VKAIEAEIQQYKKTLIEHSKLLDGVVQESDINFVIIYLIMISSGGLYEYRQGKKSVDIRPVDHVVFMRRVQSRTVKGEFFVDFIRESYLNRYLGLIEKELKEIEKRLRCHRRLLRKSVTKQLHSLSPKTEI